MVYQRKTVDKWTIFGKFQGPHGWEELTTYDSRLLAKDDLKEYRASGEGVYKLIKFRVSKDQFLPENAKVREPVKGTAHGDHPGFYFDYKAIREYHERVGTPDRYRTDIPHNPYKNPF